MQTYVFWRGSGAVRCHYETLAASVQEYNASRVRTLHLKALYYYMGDSYSDLFGCLLATFRRFSNLRELYIEAGEKLCDSDMAALLPEVPNLQHLFLEHEPDGWLEDHDHWDLSSTICQSLLHLPDLTNLYLGGMRLPNLTRHCWTCPCLVLLSWSSSNAISTHLLSPGCFRLPGPRMLSRS